MTVRVETVISLTQIDLVQCTGCYLNYHPACLDLPIQTAIKISTYPWKCPLCKLCEVCAIPGDDDKLLLCDKCDKGYHTFCLSPPLYELPTGMLLSILNRMDAIQAKKGAKSYLPCGTITERKTK